MNIKPYDLTMSTAKAQLYGGLAFLTAAPLLAWPFYRFWGFSMQAVIHSGVNPLLWFVVAVLVGVVVHELIHGYTAIWYGGIRRQDAKFGVQWQTLTPYFHSSVPLTVQKYRWVIVMPLFVLGVLPYVLALLTGNTWLTVFGVFFILAASGDLMILWLMRHLHPDTMVQDHPTKVGLIVISDESISNPVNAG